MVRYTFSRRKPSRRMGPLGDDLRRREEPREEQREEQDTPLRYGWDADGREVVES